MKNFSEECLVGSGTLGNVYKGTFDTKGILATKRALLVPLVLKENLYLKQTRIL